MADPLVTSHHALAPRADADATVDITLDGKPVTARAGQFLIAAAEEAGVFIPRFCYHPRMKPVGMCRMCLVEVSGPRGATLQPACYVAVSDGMEVVTTSDKVKKAQDGVLEFLLVNHPLDCPVCDKGGECPLQDQVLAYGPGESRFLEEKRHWAKPISLSELVLLDRERCIQCGRCVRFAAEIAGEAQIDFLGRGDAVEVNIFDHHVFSSYFSGNTVQICPVGALTATPYRFTARPWDVDQVESTCTTCSFGCRVAVQSSANRITRLLGMDTDPVNQSWMCDKGRFAYEAVNSDDRLTEPLLRHSAGADLEPATWAEALSFVAGRLGSIRDSSGPQSIGIIGGARLSNEDAYAWAKLAKAVISTDNVDAQLSDGLPAELVLGLPRATIDDACRAACVVTVVGDLREELPVLYLRLRTAAAEGTTRIVEVVPRAGGMSPDAAATISYRPGDLRGTLEALAGKATDASADVGSARAALADAGEDGDGVVVVYGRPSLAEHESVVADALAALAAAWPKARFLPALRRGNVMGALDMGLAPGILPGRVTLDEGRAWFEGAWGSVPAARGRGTTSMLEALGTGDMKAVVLLGADPLGDFPDHTLADRALDNAELVVAVDSFLSESTSRADVVFPSVTAHERPGTTTNIEGRVSRLGQKLVAPGQCWPDWMIASELAARLGGDLGAGSAAELWDEVERLSPVHAGVTRSVLDGPAARDGVVVPLPAAKVELSARRGPARFDPMATPGIEAVERQGAPPRAGMAERIGGDWPDNGAPGSGGRPRAIQWPVAVETPHIPPVDGYSLRLVSTRNLYDDGAAVEASESLAPLAATASLRLNPAELERLGVASGGSIRVRSSRGSVVLPSEPDDKTPKGVVSLTFNAEGDGGANVATLIDATAPVTEVRLETP